MNYLQVGKVIGKGSIKIASSSMNVIMNVGAIVTAICTIRDAVPKLNQSIQEYNLAKQEFSQNVISMEEYKKKKIEEVKTEKDSE